MNRIEDLMREGPKVAAEGARNFADALRAQNADVVEIEWQPPELLEPEIESLLEKLL